MAKKGQAAFEYIATYGWALLGAMVIIGAVVAIGFTNPRNQIPDSCFLGTDFVCEGATADSRGVVLIEFSSIKKVHIDRIVCTYPDSTSHEYSRDVGGTFGTVVLPSQTNITGWEWDFGDGHEAIPVDPDGPLSWDFGDGNVLDEAIEVVEDAIR